MSQKLFLVKDHHMRISSLYTSPSPIALFFTEKDAINYVRFQNMEVGRQPPLLIQEVLLLPSGELQPITLRY